MLLEAHDLSANLRGDNGPVAVLNGVSLSLSAGEIVDLIGPSGSGKTTLLRALARLLPSATGSLVLDGVDAASISPQRWRTLVALQTQLPAIITGSVADNLRYPWHLKARAEIAAPGDAEMRAALDRVHLADVALDRDAARLSIGQKARVALVRLTLTEPKVLLLDEPEASLDEASAVEVVGVAEEFAHGGGAVLRVRHHEVGEPADRRLRLQGGAIEEVPA
jgi:putative ABC transport system ATP-binding protein